MASVKKRRVFWIYYPKKRRMIIPLLAIFVIVGLLSYDNTTTTWTQWTLPLSGQVIVIDPGHGGPDGGAVSKNGLLEKDINLDISLYLRDYLQQAGAIVYMTREGDYDLAEEGKQIRRKRQDILRRAEIIQEKQAQLFISIHMNSIPSSRWSGAQTFYHSSGDPDSKKLAFFIQDEIKSSLNNTDREILPADSIYLLKTLEIPGALVEAGFLSNATESSLLGEAAYQQKIALAIYQGVLRYSSGEEFTD
ncbi:N-acetylmuramoyl-L-alanine amidase CwlD [Longirhabdus pacifica]|uniref:N-acetylmuramoyl-L-alanine amidase CwlD n=1 Tax=Longirhabdus pacifica TaxID=2305227 RepID=UPI001008DCA7|nr:N-acetylmuramoyl-L-alanine amidase CwlD [Longirhabdus pacifica]